MLFFWNKFIIINIIIVVVHVRRILSVSKNSLNDQYFLFLHMCAIFSNRELLCRQTTYPNQDPNMILVRCWTLVNTVTVITVLRQFYTSPCIAGEPTKAVILIMTHFRPSNRTALLHVHKKDLLKRYLPIVPDPV